jgi:hypothetical protein
MNFPVRISNVPSKLVVYPEQNISIPIRVVGKGYSIALFYLSKVTIDYNGQDSEFGENFLDLSKINYALPYIKDVHLSTIQLGNEISYQVDKIIDKIVPVNLTFLSETERKILLDNQYIFDDYIATIEGPSQIIDRTHNITTEKIYAGIMKNPSHRIRLISPDEYIHIISDDIQIKKITDSFRTKTFTQIPIKYDNRKYTIFPEKISVRIEGKVEDINECHDVDIHASIIEKTYQNNDTAEIQVSVSKNVKIIDYTPHEVHIGTK